MKQPVFRLILLLALFSLILGACAPAATPTVEPTAVKETVTVKETVQVVNTVVNTVIVPQVITDTPAPTAAPVETTLKVALIFPSPVTDASFSQSMYEAWVKIQTEMGGPSKLEIAKSENMFNVPDAAAAIRDYAAKGYDIVVAHGSQYGTSLQQIAPDFPKTSFAWGTSLDTFQADGINNVFAYQAEAQQGGYVQGVLAAMMSKSGIIGICGPVEAGDAKLYVDGFKAGVLATKPTAKVNITYTGSFSDASLMATAADTQIKNGADVLTGSSQSVIGAIGVGKDKGALWFGTQWDQTALAPSIVVSSQVYDWTGILKDIIASRQAGVLGNKSYTLTFKNNGLVINYNSAISVPADAKAAADAAIKGIEDGSIDPLKAQ
jgi:basic membrane lipoprotein Med (substrate-binding protein (PBP1-ABC) superfamily)